MTESVIGSREESASCGQAYQIVSLVILYIDLIYREPERRTNMTVRGCQDKRQKIVEGMFLG